ncbi:RDD family protein [Dirofilaria immitis]|nr:RDD family protein [Dirofilaria immitis]
MHEFSSCHRQNGGNAKTRKVRGSKNRLESSQPTTLMVPPVVNYGSAAAYAIELRKWLLTTQCWALCHQMATMHSLAYLASCNRPENMVPHTSFAMTLSSSSSSPPTTNMSNSSHFVQRRTIPSFTRRIFAEIIDFVFAFVAKLFIVYFLVEIGIVDLDKYDRLLGDDADLHTLIDVTQELFPIEMLAKVVVSIVEALFISYGFGSLPAGQTPGKVALNIQVITCYQVTPIPGSEEVNVVRTLNVPFKNSLIRSLTKNMLINLLFPLSAAAFAFTYNRAGYDIAARTIVVNA